MSTALILRSDTDGVATLTINRPDKLNALNVEVFKALRSEIEALKEQTDEIGCVVLRGAGKCFSAGHDLNDIAEGEDLPEPNFQANTIRALTDLPQLVITAVHGHCYTGALELALGGDMIIASENAKFGDTHAKWGLSPIWGLSQRLPRRIGQAKALEMMMTCRTYSAREAEAMGLATLCFPDAEFDASLKAFCASVLENSWYSLRENKKLVRNGEDMALAEGLDAEIANTPGVAPDAMDRVAKFTKR